MLSSLTLYLSVTVLVVLELVLFVQKNKEFIKEVTKLCQTRLCVPTLEQIGAAALYEVSEDYLKEVNTEYQKRRDITFEALSKMENVVCEKPTGAFYVIAKLPIDDR